MSLVLLAFFVVRPGYALPACDTRHDGDVAECEGDRYVCEAVLGQWVKQGGGK